MFEITKPVDVPAVQKCDDQGHVNARRSQVTHTSPNSAVAFIHPLTE